MPNLTLVYPCTGRFSGDKYIRSWQMEPLAMAVLAGLTPPNWRIRFFDDRVEPVDYEFTSDLVGISIETFTARRGYQIADEYRKRGTRVIMGGYHATFCPEEALLHCDAVCTGEAESVWADVLRDAAQGRLQRIYRGERRTPLHSVPVDRTIFKGKNYLPITLVETGRGCPFACDFCSITSFFGGTYRRRPIDEIIHEIRNLKSRHIFFVDDNITGDIANAKALFRALSPLGIQWVSQASINLLRDDELLRLMAESGCTGLLIGLESLDAGNVAAMGKHVNRVEEYSEALQRIRGAGISVYGTFLFGYNDSPDLVRETVRFAQRQKMFLCAFNHVTPFPGTRLYAALESQQRLLYDRWWLSDDYYFGKVPFEPASMTAADVERLCHNARRQFYSTESIVRRALDFRANCKGVPKAAVFFGLNFLLQGEVSQKRGLPLGHRDRGTGGREP